SSLRVGRTNRAMVITGVVLAFPLLVAAGLMIRSVGRFAADPGFSAGGILVGRLALPARDYPDAESRLRFFDGLMDAMRAQPGVDLVAFASQPPGLWTGSIAFELEGAEYLREDQRPSARHAYVTPEHFALVGVDPRRGRVFESTDREGSLPVMLVNESFARTFFPGEDAVGRRLRLPDLDGAFTVTRTIVGVVPDLRMGGDEAERPEGMYFPLHQSALTFGHVLVRTPHGDPMTLAQAFRDEVRRLDPHLPVHWLETLEGAIRDEAWFVRVFGWVFSIFGAVALFLAGVGLYGVMASSVSQRTREVGVRMAFGAERGDVLRLILRQGMAQVLAGSAVGLVLAFFLSRLMGVALYGVEPRDPGTFATVAAVLLGTGLLATVVPAVRATRLDPVEALRAE
ncbi:MAG TPA: FtsX-like permease family protein, partial [Candidatus Thermoplasmatota archaeon]